jgi:hypothetical protein
VALGLQLTLRHWWPAWLLLALLAMNVPRRGSVECPCTCTGDVVELLWHRGGRSC